MQLVLVWMAATFDVDVQGPAWQVEALRSTIVSDLTGDQLKPAARGELHVAIALDGGTLRYVLTRDGTAPVRGQVALGSVDRRALAGVLKDELHRLVPHEAVAADVDIPAPRASVGAVAALALLAAILLVPIVLARRRMRATGRLVAAIAGILVAAITIATAGDTIAEASGSVFVLGGLAWGGALAVCIPIAFPSLAGLHRVEHRELGVILRSWVLLALQRTLWVALWLGAIGAALWLAGDLLDLPPLVTFGVIAPLVVLIARLVWRALVEVVAARLDATLVENDQWHTQVHGYLVGYLRRANLDVDEDLLARMRFLAGKEPDRVLVYGGGLTHTRVVIGKAMLENALAPYGRPHDYAMPRVSTLHWTHWNAGLVMPTASDEVLASRADRDPKTSEIASAEAAEHERIALGEPPTLTGIIEPTAFDPRTSYRPDEDPLWLDWDPGEEHDGTDAGDKDFLYGVLVGAVGIAQRHEDRAATFALAFDHLPESRLKRFRRVAAPFRAIATRLADLHAVLGGARHHLAQYLGWQLWHREDLVTARAYVPQLEARSRAVLAALDKDADDSALHHRLRRLRRFIDPRTIVKRSQRQRLAIAFAVLAACAAVAALAVQAALYHSTYEERHHRDGKRS